MPKPDFVTDEMVDYLKDCESGYSRKVMEKIVETNFALYKHEAERLVEWYYGKESVFSDEVRCKDA